MTATKVLDVARGEIGYSRWNDPAAGTKYGRDYATRNGSYFGTSGVPYCAMFVTWVNRQAGYTGFGDYAYVPYMIRDAKAGKNGLKLVAAANAQPGDWVCFDWGGDGVADHVGLVELNKGTYLQTIEGNTSTGSAGSQSNGGLVARRTRAFSTVLAVVRPPYSGGTSSSTAASSTSTSQTLVVDGIWGTSTTRALQRINGTPIDGIISSQDAYWRSQNPGLGSGFQWVQNAGGSQLIAKMQRAFGVTADGLIGPGTIRAMQRYYGTPQDGVLDEGSPCIKAMQRAINRQNGY